jgi:hypothetical protein
MNTLLEIMDTDWNDYFEDEKMNVRKMAEDIFGYQIDDTDEVEDVDGLILVICTSTFPLIIDLIRKAPCSMYSEFGYDGAGG